LSVDESRLPPCGCRSDRPGLARIGAVHELATASTVLSLGREAVSVWSGNSRDVYILALLEVVGCSLKLRQGVAIWGVCTTVVCGAGRSSSEISEVALRSSLSSLVQLVEKHGDSDGGEDADDDHDLIVANLQTSVKSGSAPC
jgi:hypothetical protein